MRTVLAGGMERCLTRGQCKDQPAMTRINRLEPENVAKEGTICFRIFAINNDVRAMDHLPLLDAP
jgi:hypothetical protein